MTNRKNIENGTKPLSLFQDLPLYEGDSSRKPELDFYRYASVLARALLGTPGPFTIGVLGDWGSGKTSLMRLTQKILNNEKSKIVTVWFNAWQFEKEDHLIIPLLETIINELELNKKDNDTTEKLRKISKKIFNSIILKASFKIPLFGGLEVSSKPATNNKYEENINKYFDDKSLYFDAYQALADIQREMSVKIVIFIDDLDRCLPENAISLLESLKLVLSQKNFSFMLGVSRKVIKGYLEYRYKMLYKLKDFKAEQYLDKIIQLPFYLPTHEERIAEYTKSLISSLPDKDSSSLKNVLDIIGPASNYNPREVVRFLNKLLVAREIFHEDIDLGLCAISFSLQQLWLPEYRQLIVSEELCMIVFNSLTSKEQTELDEEKDTSESPLIKTIRNEPNLLLLLSSESGGKWLSNPNARKTIHSFLVDQRYTMVTEDDIELESWTKRYEKADKKHKNRKMYLLHIAVAAQNEVIDQIEYVEYHLHPTYQSRQKQIIREKKCRFRLKELAWGSSTVKAFVKIKKQTQPLQISHTFKLEKNGTPLEFDNPECNAKSNSP